MSNHPFKLNNPARVSLVALSTAFALALTLSAPVALAGPYSSALENTNSGAPGGAIAGYMGPDGAGKAPIIVDEDEAGNPIYANTRNSVNPIFVGWATQVVNYSPSTIEISAAYSNPTRALGPVTGDLFNVVSLGDLSASQIASGAAPGSITLKFDLAICNGVGADFAVFENAFISAGGAGVAGQVFAELAFVEVSTDGIHFARFPSLSLTPNAVGNYGTIDATDVTGLAGKHVNAYGDSWGTPFDLDSLLLSPDNANLVSAGLLDLHNVNYIRIVDIPGDGTAKDSAGNPIYDAWQTTGSGGFDLEAIGVINNVSNTPIPEPSTVTLIFGLSTGVIVATVSVRRRRSQQASVPNSRNPSAAFRE